MPHGIGRDILLREYRREDIPYARAWVNDPEVTEYLSDTFLVPQTLEMTERFYQSVLAGESGNYNFVIADAKDERYIGQIDLFQRSRVAGVMELGIVIASRDDWSRGYGRQAIALVLEYAFAQVNLHRVELWVDSGNPRAVRCYEACGFVHEGRRRAGSYRRGRYHDMLLMGVLREEWEARQKEGAGG